MTVLEIISLLIGVYFAYIYVDTNHWIANNIIAITFAVYCIENWQVGSIKVLFVVFVSLILYDTYFVFASMAYDFV